MNRAQKLTLVFALVLIFGMCLYPPWIRTDARGVARHRGYSFLLSPPTTPAEALLVNAPVRYSVDWDHLIKAWLCVAGLALPLIVLLRTRHKRNGNGDTT
jgi:hypothetical protein